jgi:DNA topoisomerase-2
MASSKINKNIEVLTDYEHVLKRPTVYVGSVKRSEEMLPIIGDGFIKSIPKDYSVGMYKLFDEVFANCIDEAKRMSVAMKSITIDISTLENRVSITDTGDGFINGSTINKKSKKSNIETAVSMLRSGSNFNNDNIDESLVGTNGMGISLVNVLSTYFEIETINSKEVYFQKWNNIVADKAIITERNKKIKTGTKISFIPNSLVFDNTKWDRAIIKSYLCLKKRVLETEVKTSDIRIDFIWDNKSEIIQSGLVPDWSAKTNIGELLIWDKRPESGSFSFMNSALCTGIHQKIVQDIINTELDDSLGHHFYETLLILNLPPGMVRFGDQNKTKFVSKREDVEYTITKNFEIAINKFFKSDIFKRIKKLVDDRKKDAELKKIRKGKKSINVKNSNKYFPAIMTRAENLFIVEGLSAMGSLLQKRDPKKDGVYALKGKIKNARNLSDLSENREILELMSILNLDTEGPNLICPFEKIVIATDSDPDGAHITSLLINLFYNWFPWMVKQNKIYFLETPLVSVGDRSKKYYYTLDEFKKTSGKGDKANTRYLKGLGSLSLDDWEYVMNERRMICLKDDPSAKKHLDMAFGKLSSERKKWLSS